MEATQHSFSNQSQVVTTPFEGYEQNDGKPKMSSTYYNKTSKTKKISPMHKTKQNMKKTHNVLGSEFQQTNSKQTIQLQNRTINVVSPSQKFLNTYNVKINEDYLLL